MFKRVATESGAVYEFHNKQFRRVNESDVKRGDSDWQTLVNDPVIEVGARMFLVMESLAKYGPDDQGTSQPDTSPFTTRVTTLVVSVEEIDD